MTRAALVARKYAAAAGAGLRNKLAYLPTFFGTSLSYGLFVFVFSRIWTAVYAGKATIAGYDAAMSVWYFAVAELPVFGFGRFFWTLAQDMKSGQVAYLLCRPYSFVLYHYAERMGPALLELCILVAEGLIIAWGAIGAPPIASAPRAAAVLVSLLAAGSIQFFLQFSIAMTAFWFEENAPFYWIYQKLSLVIGTLLPIEFLPEAAQKIAWWTPFPALSYVPARLFVAWDGSDPARLLAFQGFWLAASAAICFLVFRLGSAKLTVQGG